MRFAYARRWSVQAVFFIVLVSTVWFIGWWAILAGFSAGVLAGALLPTRRA